jgi:glycine/D-amino acid oxidase-like deaminating enzyme
VTATRSRPVSWWMEDAGVGSRPSLEGDLEVDVAILGAGFTGLWTAYALQTIAPGIRIAIVEAEHVGFGASGRNGGWCSTGLSVTPGELARRHGVDAARRTLAALGGTIDAIEQVCASEGIDARFRRGGILRIARGRHEVAALRSGWEQRVSLGLADGCELLDAEALTSRVRVADARGALFDPGGASVHPGRLVTGLAEVVERRGAAILEGTRVTAVTDRRGGAGRAGGGGRADGGGRAGGGRAGGGRPMLRTERGDVTADTVVLAGEAYLADLPRTRRRVLPVYSLIVLTEPLTDGQWSEIGWEGRESLSSHRYTVDYLTRTDDGRILFGGRGAPYHYGSAIEPSHDRHEPTHAMLREQLAAWFPPLAGIGFAAEWGGPLGLSRDWMPTIRHDPATGIAAAYGYGGQGVATAHLAGRILAQQITGTPSDLLDLPLAGHRARRWEPEPLRWLAVRYLQGALARIDDRAARTGRPPTGRSLAERLVQH